jgi:hypothetical protein
MLQASVGIVGNVVALADHGNKLEARAWVLQRGGELGPVAAREALIRLKSQVHLGAHVLHAQHHVPFHHFAAEGAVCKLNLRAGWQAGEKGW